MEGDMGWLLFGVVGFLIFLAIVIYNRLVKLRMAAQGAWADVDVQLKRRHNLVANLVETVKGYAGHEKNTLERVIQARGAAVSAQGVGAQAKAEGRYIKQTGGTGDYGVVKLSVEPGPPPLALGSIWRSRACALTRR